LTVSYLVILGIIATFSIGVDSALAVSVSVPQGTSVPGCEETNQCFVPYEVSIPVGEQVTWSNDDTAAHTVTSVTSGSPNGIFDSALFMAGKTFSHMFESAGEFTYFCMVHPWMAGIVKVGNTPYSSPESTETKITVLMNGPSTFYLDESSQIIRATVEIKNYSPSDGIYFMKVTHLPTQKVMKDFEIYLRDSGNNLWSVQVAYPILESDIMVGGQALLGEYEIQIRSEYSAETGSAKFSIFESSTPEPKSIPEPTPEPKQIPEPEPIPEPELIPKIYVDISQDTYFIGNTVLIDVKFDGTLDIEIVALAIKDSSGNMESITIEASPNTSHRHVYQIKDDVRPGTFWIIVSALVDGKKYQDSISFVAKYEDLELTSQEENERDIHLFKGKAFRSSLYFLEAFDNFEKALKIDPNNLVAQQGKDEAYNQIQPYRIKIQTSDKHLSINPNSTDDLITKGINHNTLRQFEEGYSACKKALDIDPSIRNAFACTLNASIESGKYEEILKLNEFYPHFIEPLMPPSTPIGLFSGEYIALYHLGRYDELLKKIDVELEFIIEFGKEDYRNQLLETKAIILEKANRLDESEVYYKRLDTGDINALKTRAFLFMKDFDKGLQYHEKLTDTEAIIEKRVVLNYEKEKRLSISRTEETFENTSDGGGCLIATATYGSELAPQVQQLRELRDNKLLQTESGSAFMESFNNFYYSFSPIIADYERENPVFREAVKIAITPMVSSLSILNYVDMETEAEVLGYGISLILLNIGMYVGVPVMLIHKFRRIL